MSPGILGALCLAGFAGLWLVGWFTDPAKRAPFDEGASMGLKAILCIVGMGLVAYHFVVYRKYHDDIEPDDDRQR
jgi:hypothetical protein